MNKVYLKHKEEVLTALTTNRTHGLTSAEAEARLAKFGPNALKAAPTIPAWRQFLLTLKEPLVIILFVAVGLALLSAAYDFFVTGNRKHGMAAIYESIAILILIGVNSGLGYWQAQSAKKSMDALRNMADHQARVLRDEVWEDVPVAELVPGDIVRVQTGDFLEADVRWLRVANLQTSEAHLTGEAEPVSKQSHALTEKVELGDQTNMGFSGSMITAGNGYGVVVATGMETELGKIAKLMNDVQTQKTPIERVVHSLSKKLMIVAIGIVFLTLGLALFKAYQQTGNLSFEILAASLSTAIALAVAAIPDALPAVLSIVLTIGATKLAKNQGLIKSLNSVETLGATNYIASDKTGTLTKNEMTVTRFFANGAHYEVEGNGYDTTGDFLPVDEQDTPAVERFLQAAVLNNEANVTQDEDGRFQPFGNPTDVALVVAGAKGGIDRATLLEKNDQRDIDILRVLPFDSTRKMMSVVIKENGQFKVLTKGAPDVILRKTEQVVDHDQLVPIADARATMEKVILDFANDALRTIAITERAIDESLALHGETAELEQHLTLPGIAGIIDPPRPEVKRSIQTLHAAGVHVVMITGDHADTARAIAYKLGIVQKKDAQVIEGAMLDKLPDAELDDVVLEARVYARVSPEHKQRIVKALQRRGQVVAMTGDGINDAPALRAADIGIAMGINGTEVTKDAADLILLDDKFTTIEKSVAAGRTIFGNIKNFMRHELTTNVAEMLALLLGVILMTGPIGHVSVTTPTLTALMVLWVNMISDALPSFALAYDKPQADQMKQKPRDTDVSILKGMVGRIFVRGTVMGGTVYVAFIWAASAGLPAAAVQTIAFLTLVFGQLWHVFDARSTTTLYRRNPFSNIKLLAAVSFAAVSSLLVTTLPFFNVVMGTQMLTWQQYLLVTVLPAIPTLVLSGIKEAWLAVAGKK
ncbi:cation-transporting P-type ATPase [Lacticaseibacillus casei]|uniref:cation-translocating P-type ATPase n=1 Tax=Lacticaseibacillus casei TaxID=1582 RepID=UPI001108834E|nr:cation-transporting P-type ATPase [Lacticaseibacillus casei]TLQ49952.1 cation-transporting P-type ATPase [Lacticaseibacillus casei]